MCCTPPLLGTFHKLFSCAVSSSKRCLVRLCVIGGNTGILFVAMLEEGYRVPHNEEVRFGAPESGNRQCTF